MSPRRIRRAVATAAVAVSPTLLVLSQAPAAHAADALALTVRADVAGGVGASLVVYVNGERAGATTVTTSSWTKQWVTLSTSLSPGDQLDLMFANDGYSGGQDRNLYIQQVAYAGLVVPVTNDTYEYRRGATYAVADAGADVLPGSTNLYWNGALRTMWPGEDSTDAPPPPPPPPPSDDWSYSGKLRNGQSSKVFADSSFWYRELPDHAPLDPNSSAIVSHLNWRLVEAFRDSPYGRSSTLPSDPPAVDIAMTSYTPGIFIAHNSDPIARFSWENCMGWPSYVGDQGLVADHLTGIHVPASAVPAEGSDSEMVIYNADTGRVTDLWHVRKNSNTSFTACWGGSLDGKESNGVFSGPFGATASGLPFMGGIIHPSELQAGHIDHVVGVALPRELINTKLSTPATRTDGQAYGYNTLSQGQLLRLPSWLDVDSMKLSPTSKAIAKAAQRYGLVVWDSGGSMVFRTVNTNSLGGNPYAALFSDGYVLMGNTALGEEPFPVDQLQVVAANYVQP